MNDELRKMLKDYFNSPSQHFSEGTEENNGPPQSG